MRKSIRAVTVSVDGSRAGPDTADRAAREAEPRRLTLRLLHACGKPTASVPVAGSVRGLAPASEAAGGLPVDERVPVDAGEDTTAWARPPYPPVVLRLDPADPPDELIGYAFGAADCPGRARARRARLNAAAAAAAAAAVAAARW
ncbi:hypothetical protein ACIOKD_20895 [Streptomyces sp. NPDC087844]|uniref:hypothetical protein n=1 Tax=Streptomyces sp. NPDC087844 TaxID=3365805 RepID=UPI0037FF7B2C